jgi:hypothetical protein
MLTLYPSFYSSQTTTSSAQQVKPASRVQFSGGARWLAEERITIITQIAKIAGVNSSNWQTKNFELKAIVDKYWQQFSNLNKSLSDLEVRRNLCSNLKLETENYPALCKPIRHRSRWTTLTDDGAKLLFPEVFENSAAGPSRQQQGMPGWVSAQQYHYTGQPYNTVGGSEGYTAPPAALPPGNSYVMQPVMPEHAPFMSQSASAYLPQPAPQGQHLPTNAYSQPAQHPYGQGYQAAMPVGTDGQPPQPTCGQGAPMPGSAYGQPVQVSTGTNPYGTLAYRPMLPPTHPGRNHQQVLPQRPYSPSNDTELQAVLSGIGNDTKLQAP